MRRLQILLPALLLMFLLSCTGEPAETEGDTPVNAAPPVESNFVEEGFESGGTGELGVTLEENFESGDTGELEEGKDDGE